MLGGGGYDVVAFSCRGVRKSLDGQVVRFGRPRCENDLAWLGTDRPGDLFPGALDRFLGLPPESMRHARCIAIMLGEERKHRVYHPRISTSGCMIVEIDRMPHVEGSPPGLLGSCDLNVTPTVNPESERHMT